MSKEPLERRSYRKSPGRQYGYDYDPLRSQSGLTASKPDGLLVQRPDPRRTRQFLRQSIIASKRSAGECTEPVTYRGQEGGILSTPPSVSSTHPKTTRRRSTKMSLFVHSERNLRLQDPPLCFGEKPEILPSCILNALPQLHSLSSLSQPVFVSAMPTFL